MLVVLSLSLGPFPRQVVDPLSTVLSDPTLSLVDGDAERFRRYLLLILMSARGRADGDKLLGDLVSN